jgi:hypothetical protein
MQRQRLVSRRNELLRKLESLVLTFSKVLIAVRVAGRLRGSWE